MKKQEVAYYEARAAREWSLTERLSPWYADKLIRTAERFEQMAERLRIPPQKVARLPVHKLGGSVLVSGTVWRTQSHHNILVCQHKP